MNILTAITFAFVLAGGITIFWVVYLLAREILRDELSSLSRRIIKCKWKLIDGVYETGCSHEFYDSTESGSPITDWATYCPYCGKPIKQHTNTIDKTEGGES